MKLKILIFVTFLTTLFLTSKCCSYNLTQKQKKALGKEIWKNETGQKDKFLIYWNPNEEFLSLGICHFTWYPNNATKIYTQTFPSLLALFQKKGVLLPEWLKKTTLSGAPWQNKDEFYKAQKQNDHRIKDLKKLLTNNTDIQIDFIIERLDNALPKILKKVPSIKKPLIQQNFQDLTKTPQGMFALIDYLNFKGEGINLKERYNNQGWGLLQVLEKMSDFDSPKLKNKVIAFSKAAKFILEQRVKNAPNDKSHETKWLPGWINRVNKYSKIKI